MGSKSIYRVTNNFEFATLCGAGRFHFDFGVKATKDAAEFDRAVEALKECEAIHFNSMITNEEAMILQTLKEKLGIKLFNEDARHFQEFMSAYATKSNTLHYSATLQDVKASDAVIMLGSRISTDNPGVRYAITEAARHNGAKVVYMHPLEDQLLQNTVTQFIKYEVGTEEGVMALIARALLSDADLNSQEREIIAQFDEGYLSAESNVGEEEIEQMIQSFARASKKTIVIGSDLLSHEQSGNIAVLAGLIDRYSDFSVLVVPKYVNTLGVSLVCDLDAPSNLKTVGYNAQGDYVIASSGNRNLSVGALNQQEGTVVSIDKKVLPTNVALAFEGHTLNELASALGVCDDDGEPIEQTIDYTCKLPQKKGFKAVAFDDLENFYAPLGDDIRGYDLKSVRVNRKQKLQDVQELPEFNGTVVYHCDPVLQFNAYTHSRATEADRALVGSEQFATAARISDGDRVTLHLADQIIERDFRVDTTLKGTVALNPTFDLPLGIVDGQYRFEKVKIMKVGS
jgi:NADH-quinone oxidoreductase subunit G